MKTVAVDFDGVIHGYSKGWANGTIYDPPTPGALKALRELMTQYAVFIFTSRDASQVRAWLEQYLFKTAEDDGQTFWNRHGVLLVTSRKLPAAVYIDDRAIRFTDWTQALADLKSLEDRESVWNRLTDSAVLDREDLAESLDQMRNGQLKPALTKEEEER